MVKYKILKAKKGFFIEEDSGRKGFGFHSGFKTKSDARKFISALKKSKKIKRRKPL